MFRLLAGLLLVGSSVAQLAPRIDVSDGCTGFDQACAIDLHEGLDQWVSLNLDEPIICNDQEIECAVIVNISNSHPNIVSVEPCYVRWHRDEWHHTKRVRVTARQSYQHTGRQEVHLETNVVTQSEYYRTFDPADLFIVAEDARSATCSSVGDPHYTTFDGQYWHFYDGRSRNPSRLTLYRSTTRDFVIQNQVRGYPAGNCGIAAREGRDRVVINNCGGGLQIITDFHSAVEEHRPEVTVSGSTYTVQFRSGAYVRMSITGWMNLYVGGVDFDSSCGICGNFDDNAANDGGCGSWDCVVTRYNALPACMQVPSIVSGSDTYDDLWNWQYDPSDFMPENTDDVPASQADCPYELRRIVRPVINTEDIEDITDALRDRTDAIRNQNGDIFEFDEATGDATVLEPYPLDQATQDCTELIEASTTVGVCRRRYTEFADRIADYTTDCAFDYSVMGGPDSEVATEFFLGIIRVMEQHCLELTIANGDANDVDLQRVLCENACSGHGECTAGARCSCEAGYGGDDCSINLNQPPDVRVVSDLVYDVSGTAQGMSPQEISLTGANFLNSPALTCRWGNATTARTFTTNGTYVGPRAIICPIPTFRHTGAVNLNLPLTASNDGTTWSSPDRFHFLFYDATCQRCNERGQCGINNETCTIGTGDSAQCFLAHMGATGDDANPCQKCLPAVSNTRLAFSYSHRLCRPQYSESLYSAEIYGSAQANEVILTVDATVNGLVNDDPDGYPITYEYIPGADRSNRIARWFNVDAQGNVYILRSVDITDETFMNQAHAAADPTRFSGHFQVRATDRQNFSVTTDVIIQLVPSSHRPIFPEGGFRGHVSENPAPGSAVFNATSTIPLVIQAVDPDPEADLSTVRYTWHMEPVEAAGALDIEPITGAVTVNDSTKVDFETTEVLHYQVLARDSALLYYVTDVYVNVTNIEEPPTAVLVNGTTEVQVPENFAGNIGNLSTIDPEGGVFQYTLIDNVHYSLQQFPDGVFYLNLSTPFDFESNGNPVHTFQIRSTDATGNSILQTLNVRVVNVNEAPTDVTVSNPSSLVSMAGDAMTLAEDTPLATPLASVSATDPEGGAVTCYVANQFFVIENNQLQLRSGLDFETAPQFTLLVVCEDADGEQSAVTRIDVTVTNANEAPWVGGWTNSQVTPVVEGPRTPVEVLIGTVTVEDDAGSTSASIAAANTSLFRVGSVTCTGTSPLRCSAQVFLLANAVVSYAQYADTLGAGQFPIFLTLSDNSGESPQLSAIRGPPETSVTMMVADVQEAPTGLSLSSSSVTENPAIGAMVALVTIIDEDLVDNFELTLTSNPDNAFAITPNGTNNGRRRETGGAVWMLTVNNPAAFDFETSATLSFTVSVTDLNMSVSMGAARTVQITKTISITDAPMIPLPSCTEALRCEISGETGVNTFQLSLSEMDQDPSGLTWSLSLGTAWASLRQNADGTANLVIDQTQPTEPINPDGSPNPANNRRLRVRAEWAGNAYPLRETDVFLRIIETQNAPVFAEANFDLTRPYFTTVPTPLTGTAISVTDRDNVASQEIDIFVARVITGACPAEQSCLTAYNMPRDTDTNRYITSTDYALFNNEEVAALNSITYIREAGDYSECSPAASAGNAFTCTINIEMIPAFPSKVVAGSLADPSNPTAGYFVVAQKMHVRERESGSDMQLAAFAPLAITYLAEAVVVPGDQFTEGSTGETDSAASMASWLWIIIGLVLVCVLLGLAAGYFYYQKQSSKDIFDGREGLYADTANPAWMYDADPVPYEAVPFVPGVRSAMFDWYHPKMTRKDCTDHLTKRGEGAFVVRDSDANPGWFMLGVKSQNQVIHDKIRSTDSGDLQLMPSSGDAAAVPQPTFATLPDLIDHYLKEQPGMPYTLSAADPIYDNQRLVQERTGTVERVDTQGGPAVPVKEREYAESDYSMGMGASFDKLGGDSVGNPMYFAGPGGGGGGGGGDMYDQSQGYLTVGEADPSSGGYLDVQPPPAGPVGGYMDVVPNQNQQQAHTGYSDVNTNLAVNL
jgi:hypothetical protein